MGPLVNVGALIGADAATFRQLRRVVLLGGSIERGYGDLGYSKAHGPDAEWNIRNDAHSAQKLLGSCVPAFMMHFYPTHLKFDGHKCAIMLEAGIGLS